MPLTNDTAYTVQEIYDQVANNLYDSGLRFFSSQNILDSIQDQYNKLVALLCPIEAAVTISQRPSPYYNFSELIEDYMYTAAIYNSNINRWLEHLPFKEMRKGHEFFRSNGSPRFYDVVDLRRLVLFPFLPTIEDEELIVVYKKSAPTLGLSDVPVLPHSVGGRLLECMTTGDLLEQGREFTKASTWFDEVMLKKGNELSTYDQAEKEIKAAARMDREAVLEPFRYIIHGNA